MYIATIVLRFIQRQIKSYLVNVGFPLGVGSHSAFDNVVVHSDKGVGIDVFNFLHTEIGKSFAYEVDKPTSQFKILIVDYLIEICHS